MADETQTETEAQQMKRHEENRNDDSEEEEEEEGVSRVNESDKAGVAPSSDAELKDSQLETLTNDDRREGLQENSTSESKGVAESEEQVKIAHQEVPNLAFQDAESPKQNLLQLSVLPEDSPTSPNQNLLQPSVVPEPSPTSPNQNLLQLSVVTEPSPTSPKQSHSNQKVNRASLPEANQQSPSNLKVVVPFVPNVKTPVSDGYNWRKYGQKQVKSPKGSRSYYKCTFSNCLVKKIECSDHTGHIIEIVNKGIHGHEPPRKINFARESKVLSSAVPVSRNLVTEQPGRMPNDSDPSTSSKESLPETTVNPERKQQCSSGCDGNGDMQMKEENLGEAEPNKRRKKGDAVCSDSVLKTGKKPKLVVHAAGDVGISADGYRWRKYGQKMVKGNSNPRNYYRCTSAGCPVRKHIETAVDNINAIVITYKGVHDHDMPVPKKRHGPSSAPLVAAASMTNLQLTVADGAQKQATSTKWSVGTEGELTGEAVELGGEKAMESARTLLSIGFEIKPC